MMAKSMGDLRKVPGNLKVSIIGAGKMSRLLLLALFSKLPDVDVTLVNRNTEAAEEVLAERMVKSRGGSNARVASLDDMDSVIRESDVVFTATGSREPIIHPAQLHGRDQKLMIVDIAVPLNVAAGCGDVEGVCSYTVDDLKKLQEANAHARETEVLKAQELIGDEVRHFRTWQHSQGAAPYLASMQAMAAQIQLEESLREARHLQGLDGKEMAAVERLNRHVVDRLFQPIYASMKEDEDVEKKKNKILGLKHMFDLEPLHKRRLVHA